MTNETDLKDSTGEENENKKKISKNGLSLVKLLEILISLAIPVTITIYTILSEKRQADIARMDREQDAYLADQIRLKDLFIADENLKDSLLNNYHDFLAGLLERNGIDLDNHPGARAIARFKSLAVLKQLDAKRAAQIIRSLYDSALIRLQPFTPKKPIIDLSFAILNGLNLSTNYENVQRDFVNAYLVQTDLTNSSFRDLNISGTHFDLSNMNGVDLFGSKATAYWCRSLYTSFQSTWLMNAKLIDADYGFAKFDEAKFQKSQIQQFSCGACSFEKTNLSGSDLVDSVFTTEKCYDLYTKTFTTYFTTFEQMSMVGGTIQRSDFEFVEFLNSMMMNINGSDVTFKDCKFNTFKCFECNLVNMKMNNSVLSKSHLTGSHMIHSRINDTTFKQTSMNDMDLTDTTFFNCTFIRVNFTGSNFHRGRFIQCNFNDSYINDDQWKQMSNEN